MIPASLQTQLRNKYNPDGSELRRHQLRMLDLLCEVDAICKRHGIPYCLSSGTLLGAVRHGGFIPWDDDLDIELLRKDYLRLREILPKELPQTMAWQDHGTDPNYFFFYGKVRDRLSLLGETCDYDRAWRERGIYMDIFPIEAQPLALHSLSEKTVGHMYKIWRTRTDDRAGIRKVMAIFHFNRCVVFPFLRLLCRLCRPGTYTSALGIPYHNPRYMEEYFPLSTLTFEGKEFPVPHDWDSVLKRFYGDYMTLPPAEKIAVHTASLHFMNTK